MTASKDLNMRRLTALLNECRQLGIKTADVATTVKWAMDNGALTNPKLGSAIGTLRQRIHDHNHQPTTSKRKAS